MKICEQKHRTQASQFMISPKMGLVLLCFVLYRPKAKEMCRNPHACYVIDTMSLCFQSLSHIALVLLLT